MATDPKIQYRYVTRAEDICGGSPIIRGTRTPIRAIVGYYKMGSTIEEILEGLPHLTAAQVFEALSYYHDHQVEVEKEIDESRVSELLEKYGLRVTDGGRIVATGKHEA